jgi:thiol-disulfide isomerase/thioredoxin
MNTRIFVGIYILALSAEAIAQSGEQKEYPVIGEEIPNFSLNEVQYYSKPNVTKADLKGKPAILDFFSIGCSSCFASFPKTNELNKKFGDSVNIILVGKEHENIRTIYENFRKRLNLHMPVAYEDKLLERWKIQGFPRVIWIDAKGVVKAVTETTQLDAENIQSLIDGTPFSFKTDYSYKEDNTTIFEEPLLIGGNGGDDSDFSFRSVLYPWDPATRQMIPTSLDRLLNKEVRNNLKMDFYGFQCTGASLWQLYMQAFLGREPYVDNKGNWYNAPILEISDPSKFEHDYGTGTNVYNYSIIVPEQKGSAEYIKKLMQQDLERYIGFSGSIEKRLAPYWRVSVSERAKARLRTRHASVEPAVKGDFAGRKYMNVPISSVFAVVTSFKGLSIVDETGIDFNVDIEMNVDMTNEDAVMGELRRHGLNFTKAEKERTVLVIRDAPNHPQSSKKSSKDDFR